ncbi:MAG: hypothetical protein F7C33_01185 [Desulfurococcales archaeon]|nr:hypothetical protein [Desulfurococcales archaeon]
MSRALEALYLFAAIAPFEALFGLAYGSPGPLVAYNVLVALSPLLVAGYLAYRRVMLRGSLLLGLLGVVKTYTLIAYVPPVVSALVDSAVIVTLASLPLLPPGGGGLAKAASFFSVLGSLFVLLRIPLLVALGLLSWGFSLVLAGYSFQASEEGAPN